MRARYRAFIFLVCLLIHGCNGFTGLQLEIVSWSPAGEQVTDPGTCIVSVTFSTAVDTVRTQEAFSLTAGGVQPAGRIEWNETTLTFIPYHPLLEGTEYTVTVTTGAEDLKGNSLRENFVLVFFTGEKGKRPVVTGVDPPDLSRVTDTRRIIALSFDTAVDIDSFLSAFDLSPSVKGIWTFQEGNSRCVFTPSEAYTRQEEYRITLSEDLRAAGGYRLGNTFESRFFLWSEQEGPRVIAILSEDSSVHVEPSPPDTPDLIVNTGWEKDSGIRLVFSEEVDPDSAESCLSIEPEVPFTMEWDEAPGPDEMLVSWEEPLEWHTLYRVELSTALEDLQENMMEEPAVFYLYVDGASSRPPFIERVDFVPDETTPILLFDGNDPENSLESHVILDTSPGADVTRNPFFFDFYVRLAEDAELPFFAFSENFLMGPENDCVTITCRDFRVFNPGDDLAAAALPAPTPEPDQAVIRLIVSLTDAWDSAGLILFRVYSDLEDSLGNRMEKDWMWELFDEDN